MEYIDRKREIQSASGSKNKALKKLQKLRDIGDFRDLIQSFYIIEKSSDLALEYNFIHGFIIKYVFTADIVYAYREFKRSYRYGNINSLR